jgi:hypothetical protein
MCLSSSFLCHLAVALFHGRLARKLHSSFFVDTDAFDGDFVTYFNDVLDLLDSGN